MLLRLFRVTMVLALGFCLLSQISLGQRPDAAAHQGKSVEDWFQEYVADASTRTSPTSPSARNGEFMRLSPDRGEPDPAWQAIQALGEKSVPCLVLHLGSGSRDPISGPAAAKPPAPTQPKLPNPERARLERGQAIELIHRLGVCARAAAPALLALLPESDDAEAEEVCAALQSIRSDQKAINQFLLELGKRHRDADVLQFATRLGWSGPDVARLLGELSQSSDPETCRSAITLLEAAGQGARPAVQQIVEVLKNPDPEVRYLAARSLSQLATNTPVALKALQAVADDRNDLVRNVARRTLPRNEGNTISPSIGN